PPPGARVGMHPLDEEGPFGHTDGAIATHPTRRSGLEPVSDSAADRPRGLRTLLRGAAGVGLIGATFLVCVLVQQRQGLNGDEHVHNIQIQRFLQAQWAMHPAITTIPGYHALMAVAAWSTGFRSVEGLRGLTAILSVLAIGAFFLAARSVDSSRALLRTGQFTLLPILFPFWFL